MKHIMKLNDNFFNDTKQGLKKVEFRLNDEKRKKIKIGDTIVFVNRSNMNEFINKKVSNIIYDTNFENLIHRYDKNFFKSSPIELINTLNNIYSSDKINLYGVIAIEFKEI